MDSCLIWLELSEFESAPIKSKYNSTAKIREGIRWEILLRSLHTTSCNNISMVRECDACDGIANDFESYAKLLPKIHSTHTKNNYIDRSIGERRCSPFNFVNAKEATVSNDISTLIHYTIFSSFNTHIRCMFRFHLDFFNTIDEWFYVRSSVHQVFFSACK